MNVGRGCIEAYLDIETTGLSPFYNIITVIGIYLCGGGEDTCIQLYGDDVTIEKLTAALEGADTIYTYNGKRFDLPFINAFLGVNLEEKFQHHDLMYTCWEHKLRGGFKSVERQLGIDRETEGISGYHAVLLWERYRHLNDIDALELLLKYNKEDVVNLRILKEKLTGMAVQ
jgi:uncharacterized protein